MLRLLIVLFLFAAINCASYESCSDEPEVITKNHNNPMQEYYKWKSIEINSPPTMYHYSSEYHSSPIMYHSRRSRSPYHRSSRQWSSSQWSSPPEKPNSESHFAVSAVHYKGRIFVSLPRKRPGVISTLNFVYANHTVGSSPPFRPYPNLQTNELKTPLRPDAAKIISVYHLRLDECNRLWMVDTGMLEYPNNDIQVQRPSILVFDLEHDRLVRRFEIPRSVAQMGKGMDGIAVDVDKYNCGSAYAYIPSHLERRIHIFSLSQNRMWSISHSFFGPDPLHSDLEIEGMKFQIPTDGVFSIALGPRDQHNGGYRNAYFHALSSVTEFYVSTKIFQDEAACKRFYHGDDLKILGRRFKNGHSSTHNYDPTTGVMFFAQPVLYGVACWNIRKPFSIDNQAIIATDIDRMRYASDLNVDHDGVVWLISNPLTGYLFNHLKPEEVNYRLWRFVAADIIKGTVCE